MFTNDSILLREYFFPRITFKNSVEFQKLYDHFQSIQKLPLNVTRFKESKMKGKVNIQSDYGSQKILEQSYLFKKSSIHFTVGELPCIMNVYNDSEGNQRKFIDETIQLVQFVGSLSTFSISKLIINLYLIDEKKIIHAKMKQLGKDEVNSGSCKRGDTTIITVYRIEELMKVIIHELIHAFQYDNSMDTHQIIKHYQKKYNISSQQINTNEAYTEIWANLINCYLISQRVGRNQYNLFLILIAFEKAFSSFQAHKVFYLTRLNEKNKIDINKETNVLSYFIIRNELYERIVPFLKFCKTKNKDYIKLSHEKEWSEFIKKNGMIKKNHKRFNTIKKTNFLFTTMRMSLNEIELFKHE
tara:strand:+ start:3347 stop:4417 length:1071 start_codon:yes stop_codon:yes gene_type:complete